MKFPIAFAAGALLAPALWAQWPNFATNGEPRTADGKVDMKAPAPQAADGHPDFSGVWDRATPIGPLPAQPTPLPPGLGSPLPGTAAGRQGGPPAVGLPGFQNLPVLLPGGLPFQPWAADLRKQRLSENSKDHPDAHCLPISPLQLHFHPQPRKIVQTPAVMMIVYEANNGLRQIFTDGRKLPKAEDVQPWWFGYSIGHWDGDALVVETIGFRDLGWLDEQGTPFTAAAKMTERIRRPNYGTLEIEATIDDPKTFTRVWSIKFQQKLMPDTELIEFICLENNTSNAHLVGK